MLLRLVNFIINILPLILRRMRARVMLKQTDFRTTRGTQYCPRRHLNWRWNAAQAVTATAAVCMRRVDIRYTSCVIASRLQSRVYREGAAPVCVY